MRALRITLITAVVLGGLFVAADRIAVHVAEGEAADRIKATQGLSATPEVSIKGFPFLTQIANRQLDEVDVSVTGIDATAGGRTVAVSEVRAELADVRIGGNFASATAARAEGSARVSYEDLTKSAPSGATVGYAGPERAAKGQVKVTGPSVQLLEGAGVAIPDAIKGVLGNEEIEVYSTIEAGESGTVRLKADSLPEIPVPGFDTELRRAVDYDLRIDGLPGGITLNRAKADETGLTFLGTGQGVSLVG
ncbi:LmeA family phospholipid-binding protein [Streptomyces clavuligerus]|uniref:Secreted protein n=1 Tax=Streptomyces clavuligerus TaxID=1901 RepID=E2PYT1_STRCL|nr:DUF2993 domain-containing protein [Streptomyces clavuligerus]ANW21913.1 hypothetical protein BB341_12640 [Streptomyces clavuligerus]EFG08262.1 Secreted protein [Streptomyces clavuligerus]MBY6303562.1 DUF2993 domain-containing protein [Streptomyces clavuligerus]QPL63652.1 DUF2993 domain-containing protein [Streptomyces clavuligerus]QPL69681.1 DUF2993 domain-containing protein [Streptomyces clavuligerus]